jgi:hypothetical protein
MSDLSHPAVRDEPVLLGVLSSGQQAMIAIGGAIDQTDDVHVEFDRNLIWTFTNHGIYPLSSDLLGTPSLGAPRPPFRTSAR